MGKKRAHQRNLSYLLIPVFAAALSAVTGANPAAAAWTPPTPADVKGVPVVPVAAHPRPEWTAQDRELTDADLPDVPDDGGAVTASLTAGRVKAGKLPIFVQRAAGAGAAAASTVRVELLKPTDLQARGSNGPVIRLSRADGGATAGSATVTIDYRTLGRGRGADWESRVQLVDATTGRRVAAVRDVKAGTLTATTAVSGKGTVATTLALAAAAEGENGDYKATSLSSASAWQVSQQTGSFGWSYPFEVPASLGGPKPELALSYTSSAIDGLTSGTNTQGSWMGDGFDLWSGFIERPYRPCDDDHDTDEKKDPNNAGKHSGDLCYVTDNASIAAGQGSGDLVKVSGTVGTGTVTYKKANDDGTRIELINGAIANGDADKSYWRVTSPSGTQYFYGRGEGQGGSSAGTDTNAVWTVPVYSNHPGEPGHADAFTDSRHQRAWRWNLDHVVDPAGNTMTYYYKKEGGAYGREADPDKRTTYDRGGYLSRIEYGSRRDAAASVRPAARVEFVTQERCVATSCSTSDGKPRTGKYPDTPWDQYCREAPCKNLLSPTFWTSKRLQKITTQVYAGSGDAYTDVDSWTFAHTYLDAGVNEGRPMWLKSVTHTGEVTGAGGVKVTDDPVVFNPTAEFMPNRVVSLNDGHSSLFRNRLSVITTETGAQIGITYSKPECTAGSLPKAWANDRPCFPQYYGAAGEKPTVNWFHKYRVTRVDSYDNTGGFEHEQSNYDYLDKPAWAYSASEAVPPKKRSWTTYRGYGRVVVRQGVETDVQSKSEYRYYRGLNGDKQPKDDELPPTGTPRHAVVEDSLGGSVEDCAQCAGMLREQITYNGVGGDWVTGTLSTPGVTGPVAQQGLLESWRTYQAVQRTRTHLANGGTRWTKTVTSVNAENLPTQVDDVGDEGATADDRCVRTEYARNNDAWIVNKVKRVEVVGVGCAVTPQRPRDVLSDTRTSYDSETYGAAPTAGLPVRVDELSSFNGSTPVFTPVTRTGYDDNGRVTSTKDANGRVTRTEFTPTTTGPVTKSVSINPAGNRTTMTLNPALGLPTRTEDPNGGVSTMTYDGSGRILAIWGPGRDAGTYPASPSVSHEYKVRKTAPSYVITKTLVPYRDGDTRTSITLFDGLLRTRETQTQTVGGGRAIVETVRDSRGQVEWTSQSYYDSTNTAPQTVLVSPNGRPEIPAVTRNIYDGAGRTTDQILLAAGDEKWRTHTTYAGERTSVTPPNGGAATTSVADARGHQVELRQYRDPANVGKDGAGLYEWQQFRYDVKEQLVGVADNAGNNWTFGFDLLGRQTSTEDPDKGRIATGYDPAGQVTSTRDARGQWLFTEYDDLGRKTVQHKDAADGPKIAAWTYDTLPKGKGRLTSSTRYEYDAAGKVAAYVSAVSGYNPDGTPTGTSITVPPSETGLCVSHEADPCTYSVGTKYHPSGGAPSRVSYPAVADLPAETLLLNYNTVGLPTGLTGDMSPKSQIYAQAVVYNQLDQLIGKNLGEQGQRVGITYAVDEPTGRPTDFYAIPELKTDLTKLHYDYDDAGHQISVRDTANGQTPETQCFRYDFQQRLVDAWTPSSLSCATDPNAKALGGPAPYWRSYGYDAAGDRKTEADHTGVDPTNTYAYPAAGQAAGSKPHAVTGITGTDAGGKTVVTQQFVYDAAGNTLCRPVGAGANTCAADGSSGSADAQTLTWSAEGRLAASADKAGKSSYVYDADGARLLRRDPGGVTLYLPGGQEIRRTTGGTVAGTRYYSQAGVTIAVRTGSGVSWMISDRNGTATASVSNDGKQTVLRRRALPFGEDRGAAPTGWAGDKGFVGGTKDTSGLTHLGAREYDPSLGRFISVDPVMDAGDAQQWNAYSYAGNDPVDRADPTGLCPQDRCDGYGKSPAPAPVPDTDTGGGNPPTGGNNGSGTTGGGNGCGFSCGTWQPSTSGDGFIGPVAGRQSSVSPPFVMPWSIKFLQSEKNKARAALFGEAPFGDQRTVQKTAAVAPGNGIVMVRFYISDKTAAFTLSGDDRKTTGALDAPYRIAMAWDTDTGEVSYSVTQSCASGGGHCVRQPAIHEGGANSVEVTKAHGGDLSAKYSGLNSKIRVDWGPEDGKYVTGCCSVNGNVDISLGRRGYAKVHIRGDRYPDYEAYQYGVAGTPRQLAHAETGTAGLNTMKALPFWPDRDQTFTVQGN
jgi:RHS repeat-associated protein